MLLSNSCIDLLFMSQLLLLMYGLANALAKGLSQLRARAFSNASHGRHKMPSTHNAADQVVRVTLHAADRHVPSGLRLFDVQPNRDVGQLSALQLVNSAGISRPERIGRDIPALRDVVGDGIHSQAPTRLCLYMDAPGGWIVAFHPGFHAVDEICFLVDFARDVQPHACIDFHVQCLWGPPRDQLVVLVLSQGIAKKTMLLYN